MKKVYVSPSAKKGVGYPSQYFYLLKQHLSEHFEVLEADHRPCLSQGTALIRNAFRADIFLLSFVETIGWQKLGHLQYCLAKLSLLLMKWRRRQVVLFFHNMHPHQGDSAMSRSLIRTMLRQACLVVSHSGAATEYARELVAGLRPGEEDKVKHVCHPVQPRTAVKVPSGAEPCDVLIWGTILPYKGVYEFVADRWTQESGISVRILGKCPDPVLAGQIGALAGGKIIFENRYADFDELAWYCRHSRFVLFPYLPGSVSSSGVLMDTIAMGGTPLGPDVGAFRDLAAEGVCFTFADRPGMFDMLEQELALPEGEALHIAPEASEDFIGRNTWAAFAAFIAGNV